MVSMAVVPAFSCSAFPQLLQNVMTDKAVAPNNINSLFIRKRIEYACKNTKKIGCSHEKNIFFVG
jgi:hypothetical protein